MNRTLKYLLICSLPLALMSLGYGGFWKVEKSESFISKRNDLKAKTIHFFEPEVLSISITDHVNRNFLKRQKLTEAAMSASRFAWKKNKINASFLDENRESKFTFEQYQQLMALRMEIIQSNNMQNHPLDAYGVNYNDITQSVFVNTPKIDFGYGNLAELTGSPYFGLSGFLHYNVNPSNSVMRNYVSNNDINGWGNYHYYYCIIVDVESGEIIYREFKKMYSKINAKNMTGYLYDSYYVLNKNLKGS